MSGATPSAQRSLIVSKNKVFLPALATSGIITSNENIPNSLALEGVCSKEELTVEVEVNGVFDT